MAQDTSAERRSEGTGRERRGERTELPRRGRITGRPLERREVRSADPSLSPETNARLTVELREAVGADSVVVPKDRPHASAGERVSARRVVTVNRIVLAMSLAIVLGIGAIISLTTGSWWWLVLAAGVHAAGTMLVLTLAVRITRDVEHPSPSLAAAMNEEGVAAADHRFSEMVEEFKAPEADEFGEWEQDRTVRPQDDPATASVQQARATTPTSQPSVAAPSPRATDVIIGALALGFAGVSVAIPLIWNGAWLWLTPAIIVPIAAALMGIGIVSGRREDARAWWASSRAIMVLWATTIVAVAVFCVLVVIFVS